MVNGVGLGFNLGQKKEMLRSLFMQKVSDKINLENQSFGFEKIYPEFVNIIGQNENGGAAFAFPIFRMITKTWSFPTIALNDDNNIIDADYLGVISPFFQDHIGVYDEINDDESIRLHINTDFEDGNDITSLKIIFIVFKE